ncbi:MAG: CDGSH iron-sulfur domain-containing protein, partial [Acidimicrobiia bacterium]|nr:CDGSH iron-sulfur domain-containing protein [Acidimicrobiia bacterium]
MAAALREAQALAADLTADPVDAVPSAADGLRESVVRPLSQVVLVDAADERAATTEPLGDRIVALTKRVTQLRALPDAPWQLAEAAAALQDIALRMLADDADAAGGLVAELTEIQSALPAGVQVGLDGPYLVTNAIVLRDHLGVELETRPQMALCRCGSSASKPFCDGTHATIGFSGAKSPDRVPDHRDTYVGEQLTVFDNRGICAHSGFCTDRLATVFHTSGDPFVTPSGGRMDEIIRAVRDCPSGALSFAIDGIEAREYVDRSTRQPGIEVSLNGPYRVTGGLALTDEHGEAVARAEGSSLEH